MTVFMLNIFGKNNDIIQRSLTPQTSILGLSKEAYNIYNPLDQILLVFKCYVCLCMLTGKGRNTIKINKPC